MRMEERGWKEGRKGDDEVGGEGGRELGSKMMVRLLPLPLTKTPHLVFFCKLTPPSSPSCPSPEHPQMTPACDHPSLCTRTKQPHNKQTNNIHSIIADTLYTEATEHLVNITLENFLAP